MQPIQKFRDDQKRKKKVVEVMSGSYEQKSNQDRVWCFEEVSGLRVYYDKGKLYVIGVGEDELGIMANWMGCGIVEFPFTYSGLPIGENMSRVSSWKPVVDKFKNREGGLNVGSLRAKNLALLGKWWWRLRKDGEGLWVKEIDGLGLEFTSSFLGVLGDGSDIRFWVDRWVDNRRLCDRFPKLYHLDRRKESSVMDKGSWVNGGWCWVWNWTRNIRGRVCKEFEDLMGVLQNVVVSNNCRDKWRWLLDEDGEFKVKMLTRLIEEKCLCLESGGQETTWNKLVPKKVNIFIWRALKNRLPVREELDRRNIDLDSVICPCCNNSVESCTHSLITCDLAMSVWGKNFSWWKVGRVNAFTIDEFFSSYGNVNVPKPISCLWQAVVWTTGYFVWKESSVRQ
ncbi:reverse transcriptase domain, reverse transcriptase zinc-binding domain protein [Tanacetum coccineum]|uniref:Reverse transcriptase domain, reverse transcriptase zinc-binding domain protein n=1 Tax=Tanacetum coccineum TaxID=301880 RepID=A0ABQ5HQB9_9ASTR